MFESTSKKSLPKSPEFSRVGGVRVEDPGFGSLWVMDHGSWDIGEVQG